MDNHQFHDLIIVKEKAAGVPWLSGQSDELAKFWCAWLSLCRLAVVDWDSQSEQIEFLESEISECLESIGESKIRLGSEAHT